MCRTIRYFMSAAKVSAKSDVVAANHGAVCVKSGRVFGRSSNKRRNRFRIIMRNKKGAPTISPNLRTCHAEVGAMLDTLRRCREKRGQQPEGIQYLCCPLFS
jgi:deoxycytidylate deaminase